MKTLIVNCMGGPGAGKTTTSMELTAHLKWNGILAEYVHEYAKDLVWDKRTSMFDNQIYIFAKQHHSLFRLLNQVDVIVTDSPIILSAVYNKSHPHLNTAMIDEFKSFNNLNFFLHRTKAYVQAGRYQTEDEAREVDSDVKIMLQNNKIPYININAQEGVSIEMAHHVRTALGLS